MIMSLGIFVVGFVVDAIWRSASSEIR